jgi:hypothetical protein
MNVTPSPTAISTLSSHAKRKAAFDDSDSESFNPNHFLSLKKLKFPDGFSVDSL